MIESILIGTLCGLFNGLLSRVSLKKVFDKSDKIFYSVWLTGILYRFIFLVASILYFHFKSSIMVAPFAASLIFFQFVFEVFPIKKDGNKRNS